MTIAILGAILVCLLIVCLASEDWASQGMDPSGRAGLLEDCNVADGWYEMDDDQKIPPRIKLEAEDGLLHFHTNRGRLVLKRYKPSVENEAITTEHGVFGRVFCSAVRDFGDNSEPRLQAVDGRARKE